MLVQAQHIGYLATLGAMWSSVFTLEEKEGKREETKKEEKYVFFLSSPFSFPPKGIDP